ncbi:MAG: hypothetical protein HYV61_07380 [Candidatus Rokubacteria bacterium]|nr:hypothetical protein [Candidatus Rokubacteria bacterium]
MERTRGIGVLELVTARLVAAVAAAGLLTYFRSTEEAVKSVTEEKVLERSRLVADRSTAGALRAAVTVYFGREGRFPPDKAAVDALVHPPPAFQCPGNDYTYDPAPGTITLAINDLARC